METDTNPQTSAAAVKARAVTIVGVGTAGVTMLEQMAREEFAGARFVTVNTDGAASPVSAEHLMLDGNQLKGLGTGGDPERGRALGEAHFERLKVACAGADVVVLVAGLGGGSGSGVSPVLARAARESGALVLAFVTLPFHCEGNQRQRQAQQAFDALRNVADAVMCLPHQKAAKLLADHCGFAEIFAASARVLIEGVRGVWRLLMHRGLVELHFEEICAVLRERHIESCFATVESAGATRARDALEQLPAHPLLDGGEALQQADTVIVSLMGGPDLSLADVNHVMEDITRHCRHARILMGAAVDDSFRDRLAVTLIAARRRKIEVTKGDKESRGEPESSAPEIDSELVHPARVERPSSRHVPPAPVLTVEMRTEILASHEGKGARGRKTGPRMRQTTLPLDIVNKGRFDKSEPTIHKGEDLDVPTYIRRGISLN